MNTFLRDACRNGKTRAREIAEFSALRKPDTDLGQLISLRKLRIDRLEHEHNELRVKLQQAKSELHVKKMRWRAAVRASFEFWQSARQEFFMMSTTSGQFRQAKARYERMKKDASQKRLECIELLRPCLEKRKDFFLTKKNLNEARHQHEKLLLMQEQLSREAAMAEV